MAEEQYEKFIKKHLIEVPKEKVSVKEYGQTEEKEKQRVKKVFREIRERDKVPE